MEQLKALWGLVNNKYGAWVALVVVLAIVGVAWYLGVTPAQVFTWLGT